MQRKPGREEAWQCRNHAAKGEAISYPNRGRVAEAACGASPTEKIHTKRKAHGTKAQRAKEVATAGRGGAVDKKGTGLSCPS